MLTFRLLPIVLILFSPLLWAETIISQNVDIQKFADLVSQAENNSEIVIIDVRTQEEFNTSHIAGAKVIDFYKRDFINQIEKLDKTKTYLLYCRSGNRSGKTLKLMKNLGFNATYNMLGGMKAWVPAGYPIVK